mmetsp:Transcript_14306/g.36078  ORF Transcript_14306/g.36078 Transcript_14306/m.36078 type:complete len:139 (-) Transcript_14306:122-538(-)
MYNDPQSLDREHLRLPNGTDRMDIRFSAGLPQHWLPGSSSRCMQALRICVQGRLHKWYGLQVLSSLRSRREKTPQKRTYAESAIVAWSAAFSHGGRILADWPGDSSLLIVLLCSKRTLVRMRRGFNAHAACAGFYFAY